MSGSGPCVTVLTSAVGLGIYIPALLVQRGLRDHGRAAEVEVLEAYYTPERLESHVKHRDAHHRDFALARIANRMARDVQHCLDAGLMEALLRRWTRDGRRHFIAWSGFWLPILERYRAMSGLELDIDHCRIDADISASFRIHAELRSRGREIWLWHGEQLGSLRCCSSRSRSDTVDPSLDSSSTGASGGGGGGPAPSKFSRTHLPRTGGDVRVG